MKPSLVTTSILFLFNFIIVIPGSSFAANSSAPEDLTYHSYDSFVADLNQLATDHPSIAKVYNLGSTYEDRQILAIKISDNASSDADEKENKILFIGTHHAREWISLEVPYLLAEYLVEHYNDTNIKPLIDNEEIWIIPLLNPDGFEHSRSNEVNRLWRKNRNKIPIPFLPDCHGIDLNRNYGSSTWGTLDNDTTSTQCYEWVWNWGIPYYIEMDTYIGQEKFSENETQVVQDFFQAHRVDAVLSYHSFTQLILWPWGFTDKPIDNSSDRQFMENLGKEMHDLIQSVYGRNYVPQQSSKLYKTTGDLMDWSYETYGIPSFTIELRPALGDPVGFKLPEDQIDNTFHENLPAALHFLEAYLPTIVSPSVADPSNAGPHNNPHKIHITISGVGKGRAKTDFNVKIGGLDSTIASIVEMNVNQYILGVLPAKQPANGLYDLEVTIGGSSAIQLNAINYTETFNADVMLVLDRSGSMGYSGYLEPAKNAAIQFVDFMQIGDQVGVGSFDHNAYLNFPLTYILDDSTRDQAKFAISSITEGGSTSIGAGLQTAQDQLTTSGDPLHPWAIVLLSDGYENTSPWVANVLPSIINSKTVVHTIALGPDSDQNLLSDIAAQTNGTYSFAPDASQLASIYNTVIGQVSSQQILFQEMGTVQTGVMSDKLVTVDAGIYEATFSITWSDPSSDLNLILETPSGEIIDPGIANSSPDIDFFTGNTYEFYRIHNPSDGTWTMHIFEASTITRLELTSDQPFAALVTGRTDTTLDFYLDLDTYKTEEKVLMTAVIADQEPITGANVDILVTIPVTGNSSVPPVGEWRQAGQDSKPILESLALETITQTVQLYDDGQHRDGAVGDGIYANILTETSVAGIYSFHLNAAGTANNGTAFTRLASTTANVTDPPVPNVEVTGPPTIIAKPGDVHSLTFSVKNSGFQWDTYDLRAGEVEVELGWVDLSQLPGSVSLYPGETTTIDITVKVPTTAHVGSFFALHLLAASQTDPDTFDLATLEVTIPIHRVYLPSAVRSEVAQNAGFDSLFNGSAAGWESHSGDWNVDSTTYSSAGIPGSWSSASYVGTFSDFDYQVRLKREGCDECSNGLLIRGNPTPLGSGNRWESGYGFLINRNGQFSVFKYSGGIGTVLQNWTENPAINKGGDWNELRLVAERSSFTFYINGTLVWSGSDGSYSSGRVGFAVFTKTGSEGDYFWVDWAMLEEN